MNVHMYVITYTRMYIYMYTQPEHYIPPTSLMGGGGGGGEGVGGIKNVSSQPYHV